MNYYEILEISQTASEEVIHMAYKALAKKYHPDTYEGDKSDADEQMKLINEAYETLSDADKRKKYDEELAANDKSAADEKDTQTETNPKTNAVSDANEKKSKIPLILKYKFITPALFITALLELSILYYIVLALLVIKLLVGMKKEQYKLHGIKKVIAFVICGFTVLFTYVGLTTPVTDTAVKTEPQKQEEKLEENNNDDIVKETATPEPITATATPEPIIATATPAPQKEQAKEEIKKQPEEQKQEKTDKSYTDKAKDGIAGIVKKLTKDYTPEEMTEKLFVDYYPVIISLIYDENIVFNKDKDLNVYVDGEKIGTLKQGEGKKFALILPEGEHDLKVSSSFVDSEKEKFTVSKDKFLDETLLCGNWQQFLLEFKWSGIKVKERIGTDTMPGEKKAVQAYLEIQSKTYKNYTPVGNYEEVIAKYYEQNPDVEKLVVYKDMNIKAFEELFSRILSKLLE